jgi:TolA-binding protein
MLNDYSNKQVSLKALYDIAKNTPDDIRRNELMNNIYNQITQGVRFDGYEDVYLDIGMNAYRRNDFNGAINPLTQYVNLNSEPGERRSEALYYLGKAHLATGDKPQGMAYFNQIVNSMPDGLYKTMARNELEEDTWKKSIGR